MASTWFCPSMRMRSGCGTFTIHCTSLAGSRPALSSAWAAVYWLMLPSAVTPNFLPLSLPKSRGGAHALVVERLRHVDDRVAEARAIVTAVENDHERGALGDAVEQAGIRRHQRELELARDHRRNGEGAVLEALGLDLEIELLEVALLARDEEGAPGDEGSLAHAHEIGRSARTRLRPAPRTCPCPRPTKPLPVLSYGSPSI